MDGNVAAHSRRFASGFAVSMGIGRFVYTPILPAMVAGLALSESQASTVATANYLGYLVGTVILMRRPDAKTTTTLRTGLIATVILLAAMAVEGPTWWFCVLRLGAGLASAVVFVCLADSTPVLMASGGSPGIAYGGVGIGIALSGISVIVAGTAPWPALWLIAAAGAAVLVAVAWPVRVGHPVPKLEPASRDVDRADGRGVALLKVAYLLEGIGYIIIGTYLVAFVASTTGGGAGAWVWVVAGLAAIPSPLLWSALSLRFSVGHCLMAAYLLQILAALVPVVVDSAAAGFVSAALFGATFMGITQMTIAAAGRRGAGAAPLTMVYAVGQILGPVIVILIPGEGYHLPFTVAGATLAVAMAAMAVDAKR